MNKLSIALMFFILGYIFCNCRKKRLIEGHSPSNGAQHTEECRSIHNIRNISTHEDCSKYNNCHAANKHLDCDNPGTRTRDGGTCYLHRRNNRNQGGIYERHGCVVEYQGSGSSTSGQSGSRASEPSGPSTSGPSGTSTSGPSGSSTSGPSGSSTSGPSGSSKSGPSIKRTTYTPPATEIRPYLSRGNN